MSLPHKPLNRLCSLYDGPTLSHTHTHTCAHTHACTHTHTHTHTHACPRTHTKTAGWRKEVGVYFTISVTMWWWNMDHYLNSYTIQKQTLTFMNTLRLVRVELKQLTNCFQILSLILHPKTASVQDHSTGHQRWLARFPSETESDAKISISSQIWWKNGMITQAHDITS